MQPLEAVAWWPNYPHPLEQQCPGLRWLRADEEVRVPGLGQTPEPCIRLLPSFLGPDGPVETNNLITGTGQVAQGIVRILGKDDLGREEMGSNCCESDPSPWAGLREGGTRGCTPFQQPPDARVNPGSLDSPWAPGAVPPPSVCS